MGGLNLTHLQRNMALVQFLRSLFAVSQQHYPETLGRIVVVNAGIVFACGWRLVQPLLDERTQAKVTVCATTEALAAELVADPTRRPPRLGGTCTCGCDGATAWAAYHRLCELGTDGMGGFDAARRELRAAFGLMEVEQCMIKAPSTHRTSSVEKKHRKKKSRRCEQP